MTKRMKLNNNGKFIKALSVAALAGLSFLGVNANAEQTVIENQHAESQTDDVYGGAINNPSGETIDSLDVILRDNSAVVLFITSAPSMAVISVMLQETMHNQMVTHTAARFIMYPQALI